MSTSKTEVKLTREQLYELVWTRPIRQISSEFGFSYVELAKICRKLDVPRPESGHWAEIAAGVKVKRVCLPAAPLNVPDEIVFSRIPVLNHAKPEPPRVQVPEKLSNPHEAVQWIVSSLSGAKPDEYGRLVIGSKYYKSFCVTLKNKDRALRVLDALVKTLVARGNEVQVGRRFKHSSESGIVVKAGEDSIPFYIEEQLGREPHVPTKEEIRNKERWGRTNFPVYDYFADGNLRLRIDSAPYSYRKQRSWRDGRGHRLEEFLGRAVLTIEEICALTRIEEEEGNRRKREQLRGERLTWYNKWLADDLNEMIASWQRAQRIREFLAEYERRIAASDRPERVSGWLQAVARYAEKLDPMNQIDHIAKEMDPSDEALEKLISEVGTE